MSMRIIGLLSWLGLPLLLHNPQASAYPNFISYGYQSCMNCHYNPMGGGSLTDYGRSVGATAIAGRLFWGQTTPADDEKIADRSGFFFQKPFNTWLRPSASYRGLYLQSNYSQKNQKNEWINMDGSAALVLKFLENDKLTFVGQISYAPKPRTAKGSYDEYRSREHYVGYRFTKAFGLYAGFMDKVFGIRVPDHAAFSRSLTGLNQNDQTYGLLGHYLAGSWEVAVQPFMGNLVQDEKLRQKGATGQVGYALSETARVGGSALHSSSDYLTISMYSLDARAGAGKGSSVMFELGQIEKTPKGSSSTTSRYVFMQNHWLLKQGLFALLSAEAMQPSIKLAGEMYRFGPGVQYFPTNRVEMRADIYNIRQQGSAAYADDSWTLTGQLHLWF